MEAFQSKSFSVLSFALWKPNANSIFRVIFQSYRPAISHPMISVAWYICLLNDGSSVQLLEFITSVTQANIIPSHLCDDINVLWDLFGHSGAVVEGSATSHRTETSDAAFLLWFFGVKFRNTN